VKEDRGEYLEMAGLLRNSREGIELPVAFLYPKEWKGTVVVWLSSQGKAGLFDDDGKPGAAAQKLLKSGASIMGVDMLYQGEGLADGQPLAKTPVVKNTREFAGYTFGYNRTLLANRVHDVLNVLAYVRGHKDAPKQVHLVALDETAPIAAVARALSGDAVDRLAIDTHGFRFGHVLDYRSPRFQPGAAKYHDLPGVLTLANGQETWLTGETAESVKLANSAGKARLKLYDGSTASEAAIEWLQK
jgi:hypothetical protein